MTGRARALRLAGLAALSVASLSNPVDAQSLSLDPPRLEMTAKPGAEATESLLVRNGGTKSIAVRVSVEPFSISEEGGVMTGKAFAGSRDASGWVRVNPSSLEIGPGSSEVVRVSVRVPANAGGAYWTSLFVESLPNDAATLEALSIGLRLGSYPYVSVGKVERPAAELSLGIRGGSSAPEARAEIVHPAGGVIRFGAERRLLNAKGP